MRELFSPLVDRVLGLLRSLGPYAAIELLLPGGSMVALLYWWYRQRVSRTRDMPRLRCALRRAARLASHSLRGTRARSSRRYPRSWRLRGPGRAARSSANYSKFDGSAAFGGGGHCNFRSIRRRDDPHATGARSGLAQQRRSEAKQGYLVPEHR